MKRRITCLILVVVMLMLCLASCGYSYTKDDLSKYASFDKAAFEAAINALVIEDGDYEESKRDALQMDDIYTALAKGIDTDAKLYAGVLDTNDKIYYCYYATTTDENGNVVTILPTEMQTSKAVNTQLGLSTLKGLAEKLSAKLAAESIDIEDYVYETVTSGEVKEGQIAYISYTVSYKDDTSRKDETYTYECVTVSASSEHPVAKKLVGSTVNKAIESFTDGDKTYTNAKVNWVVKTTDEKPYKELVLDPFVEYEADATTKTEKTLVNGTKLPVNGKEITYHVCPVYYYEVENFTAESVLRTLITSLTVDSLECLKDCEELIKTFKEKLTKYNEAKKAFDTASDALDTAEKNLEKVIAAVPKDEKVEDNKSVKDATTARDGKLKEKNDKEKEMNDADTAVVEAMSAIFKKVNADETKGRETVVKEYKETVHDKLLATYNSQIKDNLAKKLWEVMKEKTKVTSVPAKAVNEVYDRLIEKYEYDFHTGKDSASGKTNWDLHNGNFEKFLIAETAIKTDKYADAVAHVRTEAEKYVKDIVVIYFVARNYGLTYTDAELKEYKKDESGNYEYYVLQQGEANTLAAFQFDKMFDFFLESETNEDTGVVTYKHPLIKNFKIGEAEADKKD